MLLYAPEVFFPFLQLVFHIHVLIWSRTISNTLTLVLALHTSQTFYQNFRGVWPLYLPRPSAKKLVIPIV